jgi:hypothetical protein
MSFDLRRESRELSFGGGDGRHWGFAWPLEVDDGSGPSLLFASEQVKCP